MGMSEATTQFLFEVNSISVLGQEWICTITAEDSVLWSNTYNTWRLFEKSANIWGK